MTTTSTSKVFLFEYATCGGVTSPNIAVEGLAMFKTLYDGLITVKTKEIVNGFIRKEFSQYFELSATNDWYSDLNRFSEDSDFGLIIAPEDDGILFELTREIEGKTANLGSNSKAVYTASDKWLTFKKIKNKVKTPKTLKIKPSSEPKQELSQDTSMEVNSNNLNFSETPFLIKPRISCGGDGIRSLDTEISEEFKDNYIVQEYIKGFNISVSFLIGSEIIPLSINEQFLENFNFIGTRIPPQELERAEKIEKNQELKKEILNESTKAVESIKGLFGYVGVDLVVGNSDAYVVDINPRITTSAILLEDAYGINLPELLIQNYIKEKINYTAKSQNCNKPVFFRKIKNKSKERDKITIENPVKGYEYVSVNGYSIVKYQLLHSV